MNRSCGSSATIWAIPFTSRMTVRGAGSPASLNEPSSWGRARAVTHARRAPPTMTVTSRNASTTFRARRTSRTIPSSAIQERADGEPLGRREDRTAEDDVREADAEVHGDDASRWSRRPGDERPTDRSRRVGIVVERTGGPVRDELADLVDEEEVRILRDLGRAVRRVVDRHDEGVRPQPLVRHDLAHGPERRGRDDDVRPLHR